MTMIQPTNNKLRELRVKAGLLQIDVARAMGHAYSDLVSEWELGHRYPSVPHLFELAKMFGVTADQLYPQVEES